MPTALTKLDPSAPECSAAAKWIASHVQTSEQGKLASCIAEVLAERYSGHWYPDEPHRGSGFRAISCSVHGLDQLLVKAAQRAKQDPKKLLDMSASLGTLPCSCRVEPRFLLRRTPSLLRRSSLRAIISCPFRSVRLAPPLSPRHPGMCHATRSRPTLLSHSTDQRVDATGQLTP